MSADDDPDTTSPARKVLIGYSVADRAETERLTDLLEERDPYHRRPTRTDVYRYARREALLALLRSRANLNDPSCPYLCEYLSVLALVREIQRQRRQPLSHPQALDPGDALRPAEVTGEEGGGQ